MEKHPFNSQLNGILFQDYLKIMITDRQRKLFITSVGKHLESCGAEFKKKSDSNSTYYSLDSLIIRVSDHIATSTNHADLNIVASVNEPTQTIVIMNGAVFVFNSVKDLKTFLSDWCVFETCKVFSKGNIQSMESAKLDRELEAIRNEILALETKRDNIVEDIKKLDIDNDTKVVFEEWGKTMKSVGQEDMIASLNQKQRASIFKIIMSYAKQNRGSTTPQTKTKAAVQKPAPKKGAKKTAKPVVEPKIELPLPHETSEVEFNNEPVDIPNKPRV